MKYSRASENCWTLLAEFRLVRPTMFLRTEMVSYPFTFPLTYLFTHLLPAYLLPLPPWSNLRTNQAAAHTHPSNKERENPPDVIAPACNLQLATCNLQLARLNRPAILISFNCRHFAPKVPALDKSLLKGDDTLSLLICKVNSAISQCIYLCRKEMVSVAGKYASSQKYAPLLSWKYAPPCNGTRNTPCCSENLQLALK